MTSPLRPRTLRSAARLALALVVGFLATGASCGQTVVVEPQMDIDAHRMVVMPMKDRLNYHFDSMRGVGLARMVTERLIAKRKEIGESDVMEVIPFEDLETEVGNVHKDPKELKPADIGRMVKADLVLVGNIETFEPRLAGDVGVSRGRAKVTIKVIDVAKPDRSLLTRTIDVKYPDESRTSTGVLMSAEAGPDAIEQGLMESLAKKLSELFYEHEEPTNRG